MDVCKIGKGIFQYTAVDDCTRYRVLGLAADKTATSTLAFLDQVIAGMPFPIQRIQTDRGAEFFAYEVQERLMRERIRFRPIRPRSPHLNGKVERRQRTDLEEFWPTADFAQPDLDGQLASWLRFYNHEHPHDSFQGQKPVQRLAELQHRHPQCERGRSRIRPFKGGLPNPPLPLRSGHPRAESITLSHTRHLNCAAARGRTPSVVCSPGCHAEKRTGLFRPPSLVPLRAPFSHLLGAPDILKRTERTPSWLTEVGRTQTFTRASGHPLPRLGPAVLRPCKRVRDPLDQSIHRERLGDDLHARLQLSVAD
jgi:hypothetical protein